MSTVQARILPLIFLTLLSACQEGKTKTVEVPQSLWGSESGYIPISKAPSHIQDVAQAVAQVQYLYPSGATGFFISEDGLFLTNHHVIPRAYCNRQRCAGLRIIRDARPGGAYETFYDFDLIAQDADLDFTLIKVHLAKGEAVPYLKIEADISEDDDSGKLSSSYAMLGHPGLASLHLAKVIPNELDDETLKFKGIYIGGNSGGPLIDLKTGKVIAIGHSSSYVETKNARGFSLRVDNQSTTLVAILDRLRMLTGASDADSSGSFRVQELLQNISTNYHKYFVGESLSETVRTHLVPERATDMEMALKRIRASDQDSLDLFTNLFLGSDYEAQAIKAIVPENLYTREDRDLAGIISKMLLLEMVQGSIGRALPFTRAQIEAVALEGKAKYVLDPEIFGRFGITPDGEFDKYLTHDDCVYRPIAPEVSVPAILSLLSVFQCPPNPLLLREVFGQIIRDGAKSGDFDADGLTTYLAKSLLQRADVSTAEIGEIVSFARQVMSRVTDVPSALGLEGLISRLITRPELVLKGNWRDPKPIAYKAK